MCRDMTCSMGGGARDGQSPGRQPLGTNIWSSSAQVPWRFPPPRRFCRCPFWPRIFPRPRVPPSCCEGASRSARTPHWSWSPSRPGQLPCFPRSYSLEMSAGWRGLATRGRGSKGWRPVENQVTCPPTAQACLSTHNPLGRSRLQTWRAGPSRHREMCLLL